MLRKKVYERRDIFYVRRDIFYVAPRFNPPPPRRKQMPWEKPSTPWELSSTAGSFFPTAARFFRDDGLRKRLRKNHHVVRKNSHGTRCKGIVVPLTVAFLSSTRAAFPTRVFVLLFCRKRTHFQSRMLVKNKRCSYYCSNLHR